ALERVVLFRVVEPVLVFVLDPRNLEVQIGRHRGWSFPKVPESLVVCGGWACPVGWVQTPRDPSPRAGGLHPPYGAQRAAPSGARRRGGPLVGGVQLVLVAGGVGVFLADPVVALILQRLAQLGAAVLDDPAAVEDVDELGLDVGEDPLVVGDDQDAGAMSGGD